MIQENMNTYPLVWILLFSSSLGADPGSRHRTISYRTFEVEIDRHSFSYRSANYDRTIALNDCNRAFAEKILRRFSEENTAEIRLVQTKPERSISFKRDGDDATAKYGSRIHSLLEGLPKRISSYATLMQQPCKRK